MPEQILVVEDELSLRETLAYNLKKDGYAVETVGDGRAALEAARRLKPDLVVLDVMLPELDGFEVARILRKEMTTAILMLTARDDEIDRVVGLEVGADDYLTKPFSMRELLARVKAQLRRTRLIREEMGKAEAAVPHERLTFGGLVIDQTRREVTLDGIAAGAQAQGIRAAALPGSASGTDAFPGIHPGTRSGAGISSATAARWMCMCGGSGRRSRRMPPSLSASSPCAAGVIVLKANLAP